jgi:hypothetical protein
MEVLMDHETESHTELETQGADRETLAIIQDQTRQTFELVKALVELFLAKEGGRESPTLEELLAALIAQQRDTLIGILRLQTDVSAIAQHILGPDAARLNGSSHPAGGAPA